MDWDKSLSCPENSFAFLKMVTLGNERLTSDGNIADAPIWTFEKARK